jgi:hypothetical protein
MVGGGMVVDGTWGEGTTADEASDGGGVVSDG